MLNISITDDDIQLLSESENLEFDTTRSEILKSLESMNVQACPGSGKTTMIAAKLILLSQKWTETHKGICVLSHTNVAKNEIIRKLTESNNPSATRLLSYPHFIGTIHEFINRHLGLPYLRSQNIDVKLIDTEQCVKLIYSRLSFGTKSYIDNVNRNNHGDVLYKFDLSLNGNQFHINVPTFPNGSDSNSYKDLRKVRWDLILNGCLFFKDLFTFAEQLLLSDSSVAAHLQARFPLVLIDEMQDTLQFQDDLLLQIFPLNSESSSLQRFGDPDQAIFSGSNDDASNESFNALSRDEMCFVIDNSHRFDDSICSLISGLSFNQVDLGCDLTTKGLDERAECQTLGEGFKHTVFIFNDNNVQEVIPEFAKLSKEEFSDLKLNDPDLCIKAVGFVGNEADLSSCKTIKIAHYCQTYDKSKSSISFKEDCLLDAIYRVRGYQTGDVYNSYKELTSSFLRLTRLAQVYADDSGKLFNVTSLEAHLKSREKWEIYRKMILWCLNANNEITQKKWAKFCEFYGELFQFEHTHLDLQEYLKYKENTFNKNQISCNSVVVDDLTVELGTIHSVKGETHDGTLVLETKRNSHDIGLLIEYITGKLPTGDNKKLAITKTRFMRQLYVAASRPRYLLCLAIHQSRVTPEIENDLDAQGWNIHKLAS